MWKYITKEQTKDFLLSLNLIDDKLSDKEKINMLYSISNNIENNYRIFKIKKRNGKLRTIYEPNPTLKNIQRRILNNILNNKSISKYAKAYKKGISLKNNAIEHINKEIILKLDIKDFFENIKFSDIYDSCFSIEYFPKEIGMLLTHLCTYNNHLTQGSPTSAYISNLVMKEFDEYIGDYCEDNNISYTRYSDDLTFSGNFNPSNVIKIVRKALLKLNLEINDDKTCIINKGNRQTVTGITVNEKAQICSKYRKNIRKEIYYIKKFGIDSHLKFTNNNITPLKYLRYLSGKINYVIQINNNDKEFLKYKTYINELLREKRVD